MHMAIDYGNFKTVPYAPNVRIFSSSFINHGFSIFLLFFPIVALSKTTT